MTDMKINLSDEPQKEILKAINKISKRLDNIENSINPEKKPEKNAPESPTINENKPTNDMITPQIPQEQKSEVGVATSGLRHISPADNVQYIKPKWRLKLIISFIVFIIITMVLYYFFKVNFKMTSFQDIAIFSCISGIVGLFGAYLTFNLFNVNQKLKFYQMNYQQNEVPLIKEEINYPSRCPICNSKLLRGKIQKENNKYAQILKCKNKNCAFQQEYNLIL